MQGLLFRLVYLSSSMYIKPAGASLNSTVPLITFTSKAPEFVC